MYANNDAISIDRDPVHGYKMYKDIPPPSMLEPDSSFYLSDNYFQTETRASVEGKNWFKAQPVGVNKLRWYGTCTASRNNRQGSKYFTVYSITLFTGKYSKSINRLEL